MPTSNLLAIVGKIVALLKPLSPDDRSRVINASRTLLGDTMALGGGREKGGEEVVSEDDGDTIATSGKAKTWQRQNGITGAQLSQVFHSADGKTDVIAGVMPGKNNKEKTLNAYVLTGVAHLIAGGEPKFTDKDARALCTTAGCYDQANHAANVKERGNLFTGTKEKGWTLTAPGLTKGANLIKTIAPAQG